MGALKNFAENIIKRVGGPDSVEANTKYIIQGVDEIATDFAVWCVENVQEFETRSVQELYDQFKIERNL